MEHFNYRKNVRNYFLGAKILPRILIIVGIIFLLAGLFSMGSCTTSRSSYSYGYGYSSSRSDSNAGSIISVLIGAAGIVGGIVLAVKGVSVAEAEVDQATQCEIDNLKERGMKKLNVISEQINLIKPIVIYGAGVSPDSYLGSASSKKNRGASVLLKLLVLPITILVAIFSIFKKKEINIDPIERYKIGSDTKLRYMLLQVTVFAFTEHQLLIYSGNVDISTGIVYDETTAELFYTDISNIATNEELTKYFHKNRFIYKKREYVVINGNGMNYVASFTSDVAEGQSRIDNEFAGMRNLIREKKISG